MMSSEELNRELADCDELHSLSALLTHSEAVKYFKMYLTKSLTLESALFWLEANKFVEAMNSAAKRVWARYIEPNAQNSINIAANLRSTMQKRLVNASSSMFDEARDEIHTLMQNNSYRSFLRSIWCLAYLEERQKHPPAQKIPIPHFSNFFGLNQIPSPNRERSLTFFTDRGLMGEWGNSTRGMGTMRDEKETKREESKERGKEDLLIVPKRKVVEIELSPKQKS
eukprot:TRINITY_DN1277_c0_g2_i1.p1 TRINITY_DN1277_c0_g2~~TRINITY_DN1277_c0_g2_i1.p1  ORF type:complete len:226 (+),score=46.49 TRINITY_DN1277_c0_g2_i1:118-795(+)